MKRELFYLSVIALVCSLAAPAAGEDIDILKVSDWQPSYDEFGSTASVTTGDVVTGEFNQVAQPDPNTWPWVSLLADITLIGDNLEGVTSVKVTYTCNVPVLVILPMPSLSGDGLTHRAQIPAASSFSTETLATGDFKQPVWVTDLTDLDLSKVLGVEFVPVFPAATGGEATLALNEVILLGFTTPIITDIDKTPSHGLSISSIAPDCITFTVPQNGYYTLSVYAVNGRMYAVSNKKLFLEGRNTVSWNSNGISTGLYVIELNSGKDRVVKKVVLR